MLKFVDEKSGKVVMTESDNGDVDFHINEDKSKEDENDKKED